MIRSGLISIKANGRPISNIFPFSNFETAMIEEADSNESASIISYNVNNGDGIPLSNTLKWITPGAIPKSSSTARALSYARRGVLLFPLK